MNEILQRHQIGDKASLSTIRRSIRSELANAGIDPAQVFDCLIAVTEACTNALVHGRDCDGEEPAPEIVWDIRDSSATFWVRDFSSARRSRAVHPAAGDSRVASEDSLQGMGIALMDDLMDHLEIRRGPAGTVVTLRKEFGATS
ncbi:MAG TPA: ATP-binding protein [Actinomycetota bacterium]|nr:ATP-binding protein [Actinomycetota bacterium]